MNTPSEARSVERLFPFVLRAGILVVGREALHRRRGRLHFILITEDLSENSRGEILRDFGHCPVLQHYTAAALERHFHVRGTKVVGFMKSDLARSLYNELKSHRINSPTGSQTQSGSRPTPPSGRTAPTTSASRRRARQ